jgi:hypothetical protein
MFDALRPVGGAPTSSGLSQSEMRPDVDADAPRDYFLLYRHFYVHATLSLTLTVCATDSDTTDTFTRVTKKFDILFTDTTRLSFVRQYTSTV